MIPPNLLPINLIFLAENSHSLAAQEKSFLATDQTQMSLASRLCEEMPKVSEQTIVIFEVSVRKFKLKSSNVEINVEIATVRNASKLAVGSSCFRNRI